MLNLKLTKNNYLLWLEELKWVNQNIVHLEYTVDERELITLKVALYVGEYAYKTFI